MAKKTIVLLGAGRLAGKIAGFYAEGRMPAYEIVGVVGRDPQRAAKTAGICGCPVLTLEETIALSPDFVAEAASVAAVQESLLPILEAGISFVALSVGALADDAFVAKAKEAAEQSGAKLYLPGGAIGGYDLLQTITAMEDPEMEFQVTFRSERMKGTAVEDLCPAEGDPAVIFEGTAREAIALLPRSVNISVAAALATLGPDKMHVTLWADPEEPFVTVRMKAGSKHAEADFTIAADPSELVSLSVVACLNNLASPIQFG